MAWLEQRGESFRIKFRHGGRLYQHPLKTTDRRKAEGSLARLEENLLDVERGRLEVPPGADLPVFLLSDGKLNATPVVKKVLTLSELFASYQDALPLGGKEENTRATERIHIAHLTRILGSKMNVEAIDTTTLQTYVDKRALETGRRGKKVSHVTIRKEVGTFSSIWNKWAQPRGLVLTPAPTRGLTYHKTRGKPRFQTWEQIERKIARGGLSPEQELEMWDSVFLTLPEIKELLANVQHSTRHPFVFAMFAFAAHTGARRSEILRSQVDDFDLAAGTVMIREKKRDRSREMTFRTVPLSPYLKGVMEVWFARHPGGQVTICEEAGEPLTVQLAAHHFRWSLDGSKWEKLRGWHVFRHSFVSNCAARGVDQRMIDEWVGHQTEEMRKRYRHLFPDQQHQAIRSVFGEG